MSVRFILGPAGSGKTTKAIDILLESVRDNPDKTHLYIVPEQFTLQTQKALVKKHPNHSVMDIDILSFNRLAFRVLKELGKSTANVLEDSGKSMVIRKILNEYSKDIITIRSSNSGMISEIKSCISEFMQYQITPKMLSELLEKGSGQLGVKALDMSIIYEKFLDFLGEDYITAELILELLNENVVNSDLLKDCVIVFDGFTGFTPVQYDILSKLISVNADIYFCITLEDKNINVIRPDELFYMSKNFISKVRQIADYQKATEKDPIILTGKRQPSKCEIIKANTPKEELEFVASSIREMVISGRRYKDIAIVSADPDIYEPYYQEVFKSYDIPVFFDRAGAISNHRLAIMIESVARIVKYNYKTEDVISLLKTGLVHELDSQSFDLENYLLATGVSGNKYYKKGFIHKTRDIDEDKLVSLNQFSKEIFAPVIKLSDEYSKGLHQVSKMNESLYNLLCTYDVERQLFDANQSEIYDLFIDSLEKIENILGNETMEFLEYSQILLSSFTSLRLRLLPKTGDCIVFGDTVRTRLDDVDVLFLVGANDGVLPRVSEPGRIFSERDRKKLATYGITLSETQKERRFAGEFYFYLTKTRPKSELYISYTLFGSDGELKKPSYILRNVREQYGIDDIFAPTFINTKKGLIKAFAKEVQSPVHNGKLAYMARKCSPDTFNEIMSEAFPTSEDIRLSPEILESFDTINNISVSRLETFNRCAYAYFLNYILRLKEPVNYGINSLDLGNIYHDTLYHFFSAISEKNRNIRDIDENQKRELIRASFDLAYAPIDEKGDFLDASYLYEKENMIRTMDANIFELLRQITRSKFNPKYFEIELNKICNPLDLKVNLQGNKVINLTGKIDRVDLYDDAKNIFVKVIDYKSGTTKLDYTKLSGGLQMQLLFYLNAIIKALSRNNPNKNIIPAAFFYYKIDDPIKGFGVSPSKEKALTEFRRALRPVGLINDDRTVVNALDEDFECELPSYKSDVIRVDLKKDNNYRSYSQVAPVNDIKYLMNFVEKNVNSTALEILEGKTTKLPFRISGKESACDYCNYHSICSFNKVKGWQCYRELIEIKNILDFKEKNGF